jgi:hypothetical protein
LDCRLFILAHKAAVAEYVGTQYGREPAFHPTLPLPFLSAKDHSYQVTLKS